MKKISRLTIFIFTLIFITSCASRHELSDKEKYLLSNPPRELIDKVDLLLPEAEAYSNKIRKLALSKGRQLKEQEVAYAKELGIKRTGDIRILVLSEFPSPDTGLLLRLFKKERINSIYVGGYTVDHVIMIKEAYSQNENIIKHEMVHVLQFERLGFSKMFKQYYLESQLLPYLTRPLEKEAFDKTPGGEY